MTITGGMMPDAATAGSCFRSVCRLEVMLEVLDRELLLLLQ